jgi:SAM-dependent methyltransferase
VLLTATREERIRAIGYDYDGQPKRRVEKCNLCGRTAFANVTQSDRYGFSAGSDLCLACGLVFLNPQLTEEAYADFYARVYRPLVSAYHGRLIDPESIEAEQAVYAEALAGLIEPWTRASRGGRLLDVGGSTGVVAELLSIRFGLEGAVLDPAPAELERAAQRGLVTIAGTIESAGVAPGTYAVVTMCQTVDHLLDIAGALATIANILDTGGIFFMDIVDFRAIYLQARNIEQATKIDHPYSLTEQTAERYLAQAGFRVLKKDSPADQLHIGYVCVRGEPRTPAPEPDWVESQLAELRLVQTGNV